ncbi:MAG: hypothetical protein IT356_01950 [Gemmatimonadaceae bacterium]|nr:hypothetical protein [Gemmatimonadaceae bacterium]
MKMFWIIYAGPLVQRVTDALLTHGATGYTTFPKAYGTGTHGPIEGTRAWPGEETVITSVVAGGSASAVSECLASLQRGLDAGERLHFAVLDVESFQ